jgi:hypothetical protein
MSPGILKHQIPTYQAAVEIKKTRIMKLIVDAQEILAAFLQGVLYMWLYQEYQF